jgi:hypothetical protein
MVLVYVDDILVFAKEPKMTMDGLGKLYELKPESVHEPDIYLGVNMEKVQLSNGKVERAMGSKTYIKNAIKVVERRSGSKAEVDSAEPIPKWL